MLTTPCIFVQLQDPLEFYGFLMPKLEALKMDSAFLNRNVNEGFSGDIHLLLLVSFQFEAIARCFIEHLVAKSSSSIAQVVRRNGTKFCNLLFWRLT